MEKERKDALEVEKKENEKRDESPQTEEMMVPSYNGWEHGVARHHRGLQLGDDWKRVI